MGINYLIWHLSLLNHGQDGIPKKVHNSNGTFRFKGECFKAGKAFNGEYIAIKETNNSDEFSIFFMDNFIKKIKLSEGVQ